MVVAATGVLMVLLFFENTEQMARLFIGWVFLTAVFPAFVLFQIWDLHRPPVPDRTVTARLMFDWLVLGIRRKELGPADGWTALTVLRGLLPSRISVHHLKLGESIDLGHPLLRFPARKVRQVTFAPDPAEDYLESDRRTRLCEASVGMDSGKHFHLILDEADAERLRHWAATRGITVRDCDGYRPPAVLSVASADEPAGQSSRGHRA
jgi:hypothetical protein